MEINKEEATNEALKAAVTGDLAKLKQLYQQHGKGSLNRLSAKVGTNKMKVARPNSSCGLIYFNQIFLKMLFRVADTSR